MQKTLLAAAFGAAVMAMTTAASAASFQVSDAKSITTAGNISDSYHVQQNGSLNIDVAGDVTFTPESKSEKYTSIDSYTPLFIEGGSVSIKAATLKFESVKETTNDPNKAYGVDYFAGWMNGDSKLTIDVDKLLIGTAENGGDRVFQMKNGGNVLKIFAKEIVSYQGDGFINAQGTGAAGANVVNIGSADRRVKRFESHTTWGDQDYGVAILQANEGATVSLYADEVILDGSHNSAGGVIGSGSYGTVKIDAKSLTIDGNICGTYGTVHYPEQKLTLDIKTDTLQMTGDVNLGSQGSGYSNFNRATVLNLVVTENAVIDGDVNVIDGEKTSDNSVGNDNEVNLTFNGTGAITGTINVDQNTEQGGTSTVNLGGNADMTASSGKFNVTNSAAVNFLGSGEWAVNEWSGTDGKLGVAENVTLNVNTAVTTAETKVAGENANLVINEGGSLTADALISENGVVTLNTVAETPVITSSSLSGALGVKATAALNDSFANADEAMAAVSKSIAVESTADNAVTISGEEGEVNGVWSATIAEDGTLTNRVEAKNTKLDAYSSVSTLAAIQWRNELNDLNKRMGDLRDNPGAIGAWARLYGSEQEYGAQNVTNKSASVQVGGDYQIGAWKVGGAFSYTDGSSTYDAGDADNEAYTVAVYGTWLADNGMFLDLIGKYGRLSNDFELGNMSGSTDNNAYSVSAELGWRFEPCAFGFIEPQAEITYGRITGDTVTTSNNVRISQDDFDTLIGRLGVRVGAKFPNDRGNVYLRVSGAYDFKGENDASVRSLTGAAATKLHDDLGGGWIETAVGANFRWSDATNIYVDLERNNGGEVVENWRWNVGMRYEF